MAQARAGVPDEQPLYWVYGTDKRWEAIAYDDAGNAYDLTVAGRTITLYISRNGSPVLSHDASSELSNGHYIVGVLDSDKALFDNGEVGCWYTVELAQSSGDSPVCVNHGPFYVLPNARY